MQHLCVMAAAASSHSQLQFAKASDTLQRQRRMLKKQLMAQHVTQIVMRTAVYGM